MKRLSLALCVAACVAGDAAAQQLPDLAVSRVAGGNDYIYHGQAGGLAVYAVGTTSCNVGNVPIQWVDPWDMPVIGQNMFRIKDGQIEQLGYSFLKPGFCAVNEFSCGSCQTTNCDTLGIGCADTYGAGLNDGANGWAKWAVDANRGEWFSIPPGPVGALPLRGRLQVEVSKLQDPAAVYITEGQYVSGHDQLAGLAQNNQSWRYTNMSNLTNPSNAGAMHMLEPAIMAWQDTHPDVRIEEANVLDEGGPGIHGFMWLGSKATDLGNGTWRYDYAIQNTFSERCVGSIAINLPCTGVTLSNAQFYGISHHSGSPYSDAPWTVNQTGSSISWTTEDFAQNANANAVRWGNLYAFSFDADAPPLPDGNVTLGLFEPGTPSSLDVAAIVPASSGFESPAFCTPTNTSVGVPVEFIAAGTPLIAANDFLFECFSVPQHSFGYFLMSLDQAFVQLPPGSAGNLCLGGSIVRFAQDVQNSGIFGYVIFEPDANNLPNNVNWMPGETWNFQYWTRDGIGPSNFSNLQTITFCQ